MTNKKTDKQKAETIDELADTLDDLTTTVDELAVEPPSNVKPETLKSVKTGLEQVRADVDNIDNQQDD